jgi:hypothetical protein
MVYTEHIGSRYPFLLLNSVINDNIAIIRTISTGVPRIIPVSYVDNIYNINDPWLGRVQYSIEELKVIWGIRDYQFFLKQWR